MIKLPIESTFSSHSAFMLKNGIILRFSIEYLVDG